MFPSPELPLYKVRGEEGEAAKGVIASEDIPSESHSVLKHPIGYRQGPGWLIISSTTTRSDSETASGGRPSPGQVTGDGAVAEQYHTVQVHVTDQQAERQTKID